MSAPCPNGHLSENSDYCSDCGAPMASGARSSGSADSFGSSGSSGSSGSVAVKPRANTSAPKRAAAVRCPSCASLSKSTDICGACGFQFAAADSVALWEEQLWEVVARPDRQYYDMIDPEGMEFPARGCTLVGSRSTATTSASGGAAQERD